MENGIKYDNNLLTRYEFSTFIMQFTEKSKYIN